MLKSNQYRGQKATVSTLFSGGLRNSNISIIFGVNRVSLKKLKGRAVLNAGGASIESKNAG